MMSQSNNNNGSYSLNNDINYQSSLPLTDQLQNNTSNNYNYNYNSNDEFLQFLGDILMEDSDESYNNADRRRLDEIELDLEKVLTNTPPQESINVPQNSLQIDNSKHEIKQEVAKELINTTTLEVKKIEKQHAIVFCFNSLEIDNWKINACNGGLRARFYYIKNKREIPRLIWQINGKLNRRIEVPFSSIKAIRGYDKSVIEIMLEKRPQFYIEKRRTASNVRQHDKFEPCKDFTPDNQASRIRFHKITLEPCDYDKLYDKIIRGDQGLYEASQIPFPYNEDPCFPPLTDEALINTNVPLIPNPPPPPDALEYSHFNNNASNTPTQYIQDNFHLMNDVGMQQPPIYHQQPLHSNPLIGHATESSGSSTNSNTTYPRQFPY